MLSTLPHSRRMEIGLSQVEDNFCEGRRRCSEAITVGAWVSKCQGDVTTAKGRGNNARPFSLPRKEQKKTKALHLFDKIPRQVSAYCRLPRRKGRRHRV